MGRSSMFPIEHRTLVADRVIRGARRLLLVLAALFVVSTTAAANDALRLTYLFSDGQMPVTLQAFKAVLGEHPQLRNRVELAFVTESTRPRLDVRALLATDVLVFDMMNQQMLDELDAEHGIDLIGHVAARGAVLAVGVGLAPIESFTRRGAIFDERAHAYWQHSGLSNQMGLVKLALGAAGVEDLGLPEPQPSLEFGYYYPDSEAAAGGRVFASWEAFDAWRESAGKRRPGAPRVAVGFYKANYYSGDTQTLDAVIAEIERRGAEAVPVFGYPGALAFEHLLLDEQGEARVDVALAFLFRFSDFETALHLAELDVPVLNLVTLYGRSEQEWRDSATGLSMFEGTFQVAVPELAGLVSPIVVGSRERRFDLETGVSLVANDPIPSRIEMGVRRALAFSALRETPNADKRIALMYYNYPPGKASIGASYLNVAESLANILTRLQAEGYDLGEGAELSAGAVLEAITTQARNVGGYAPGELREMLSAGDAVRVPLDEYEAWLAALAPALGEKIAADWGPPGETELMAASEDGETSLIVPLVRYGNVILLPQPARGWGEDHDKLYHAQDLAPHHQYVAAYEWLRHGFGAHAVVHLGTHGTHEWLDGKDVGQTEEDASDALIGELPNIYVYNVDVVGEGLVARRRGLATLIDHMVPPFVKGGLYAELAALSESINDYDAALHRNPTLAEAFGDQIREQVIALRIDRDLGLDIPSSGSLDHDTVHDIIDYMRELREQNIPYGLHAFGRAPHEEALATTVEAIVETDRSLIPTDAVVLAEEMEARILGSAERELENLARALDGRFIPVGSGGEPIRNPDAYPTGKNFYSIDPEKVPKRASWTLGVKLANEMLERHLAEHGRYPEKVSFVIWGDETLRHEGVLESQILHLLGTRPVWDDRDKVVDVEVVPSHQLGRPRVDIVIASAAEGMFNNITLLMDKAVQLVKMLEEAENYVRRNYLVTRAALIELGYSEEQADRRAGVRIFDEPPGIYNLAVSQIAESSGTWDSDHVLGDDYLRRMGHGFGNGFWGEPMEDVFRLALSGTEKVVHSSSTMLYGALDNDDFYMYMGGLASAIRNLDGETPELVVTNTRDPANPRMTSIDQFIGSEFRTRYVNPTWITGMQAEGYAGAGAMREFVEYMWGWDATVTEVIDEAMWQETFEVYVEDKHDLDIRAFFDARSPFAFQDITARMLETVRKEYWNPDEETLAALLEAHVGNVNTHGVGCSEVTCGNPRLVRYVVEQALGAGVPVPAVEAYVQAMEQAIGASIDELAAAAEAWARLNDARVAGRPVPGPEAAAEESVDAAELQGYLMRSVDRRQAAETASDVPTMSVDARSLGLLWVGALLLGLLGLWRWRHGREG
jgi:cobaltochelatase CobN